MPVLQQARDSGKRIESYFSIKNWEKEMVIKNGMKGMRSDLCDLTFNKKGHSLLWNTEYQFSVCKFVFA